MTFFALASVVSVQAKEVEIGLDWTGLALRPCVFLLFIMFLTVLGDWVLSDWLEVSLCVGPQISTGLFFRNLIGILVL